MVSEELKTPIVNKKSLKLIVISDGTGETATGMIKAAMAQFKARDVLFTRYKNIRTKEQLDHIFTKAAIHHDMIAYTIVSADLREYMGQLARINHIRSVDLLGNLLTNLSSYFEIAPTSAPGAFRDVNEEYFQRVSAMEFTLSHDDGVNTHSLHLADVILIGVSRTSKTPLSMYLSFQGIKVVNIPLIPQTPLNPEIFKVDQRKIFGLTIDPHVLHKIRLNRLNKLGNIHDQHGKYANILKIIEEVEWANALFKKNKRWPVFNVTGKAIEETASEVIRLLNMRKENLFKQGLTANRSKKV